ncbi:hypothetical protein [Sphingobacterium anhuiense]|uniref:hypothetical protein n=1 Tax=Sphingobacterium anhuiense TaxID=493780 RepID=UPI003C2E8E1F
MKKTNSINKAYEQKHLANIRRNQNKVKKSYQKAINKIYAGLRLPKAKDSFNIERLPQLNNILNEVLAEWQDNFLTIMVNGVHEAWNLSDVKIDEILGQFTVGRAISPLIQEALFSRNAEALQSFLKRTSGKNGLGLSQRVWNYSNQFRYEIENNMAMGISEGKSAAEIARDQKKYLQEPDRLFRRIRDFNGNLVLSKAAKAYSPGQGVYRSSYKNALRLTRTETNIAYRSADNDRYSQSEVILGYEVQLSARHPTFDICDHLKGKYPKDFKFVGWHPQCICYTVPVLPSAAEYDKFEDALLSGGSYKMKGQIKNVPSELTKYVQDNSKMLKGLKSVPYWMRDNNIKV